MTSFNLNEIPYGFYLFSRLSVAMKLVDKELEYDLAFETTLSFYKEFVDSEFNDLEYPEYDCIVEFIKHQLGEL